MHDDALGGQVPDPEPVGDSGTNPNPCIACDDRNPVKPTWHVYIVRCSDGTLYTGIAKDLGKRIEEHNSEGGARYTKGRRPVSLVYSTGAASRSEAAKLEHRIKKLPRSGKLLLINEFPAK